MEFAPVQSDMLLTIGYDPAAHELEAVYSSGRVWRYRDVPESLYHKLSAAESKGRFMRSHVIGVYPEYRLRRR